jgi:hypothetical protein
MVEPSATRHFVAGVWGNERKSLVQHTRVYGAPVSAAGGHLLRSQSVQQRGRKGPSCLSPDIGGQRSGTGRR